MKEVEQEFLVTKTIQEVEPEKEMDVNYVGVYITDDDKVSLGRSFRTPVQWLLIQFPLFLFDCLSRVVN
jgi:hypothetical protein